MNRIEFLRRLNALNLPRAEFVVLSGGALLMYGLRETTQDVDLAISSKLARELQLKGSQWANTGFYKIGEDIEVVVGINGKNIRDIKTETIDGYRVQRLEDILEFKKKLNRPKDRVDIKRIVQEIGQKNGGLL